MCDDVYVVLTGCNLSVAVDGAREAETKHTSSVVVTDGIKKRATRQSSKVAWGRLISQYTGQVGHIHFFKLTFYLRSSYLLHVLV